MTFLYKSELYAMQLHTLSSQICLAYMYAYLGFEGWESVNKEKSI